MPVGGFPLVFLRSEGGVLLALAVFLYARSDASWLLFLLLILAPDISMVGYAAGPRAGAVAYNVFHTYAIPALLLGTAIVAREELIFAISLIWFAHIGADRLLGFGLKETTGFADTHLGRIGGARGRRGSRSG